MNLKFSLLIAIYAMIICLWSTIKQISSHTSLHKNKYYKHFKRSKNVLSGMNSDQNYLNLTHVNLLMVNLRYKNDGGFGNGGQ